MKIICPVCMHHCALREGQTGICRARKMTDGRILSLNYGRITAMALDPVEKKPLNRFFPGSNILSVGSFGCNLRCPFCQNHEISMHGEEIPAEQMSPEALVELAVSLAVKGNIGVAYTYNEPLIGYEYVRDTARLVRRAGMKNVVVTNGCIDPDILEELLPDLDALNIDLKGFTDRYYQKLGGDLETVKRFIRRAQSSCHIELTTLIVPGENDTEDEMEHLASWVRSVNPSIPLHVTRFFPRYRMSDFPATSVQTVYMLADTARKQLDYVYTGNC
ncbi:AmmeMemoRadiSam system radical SAM enzyme [Ruminococcus gauvreauii]|uniref:AmmeMemoRadiSam system radical SAM enzyme n=1 Tax=Ruminococcus gauvreauii TaxID=438033 RepID=A0ABY5VJ01_9FIRM|nr:AmmeMemoRadiSam system radical SAM enzyme [Ruminococcus gauvreauii]UWP60169.1 AmmeMemoRadiSam system radical SAM enzyme [Ruminococcus gauvreauii]